jgi:hypothetical protein
MSTTYTREANERVRLRLEIELLKVKIEELQASLACKLWTDHPVARPPDAGAQRTSPKGA